MAVPKEMTPLISVIVPCFNHARYLPLALDSVRAQTYQNWECLIINDGSTDTTEEVATRYVDEDSRFIYLPQSQSGLPHSRNVGVERAAGDFLQFLDADDQLRPFKFEHQIHCLQRNNADICIADYIIRREFFGKNWSVEGVSPFLSSSDPISDLLTKWEVTLCIPCHVPLIRSSFMDTHRLCFNEDLRNHEDWVFWCEFFFKHPSVCFAHEIVCEYFSRSSSMTSHVDEMAFGFQKAADVLERICARDVHLRKYLPLIQGKKADIVGRSRYSQTSLLRRSLRRTKRFMHDMFCWIRAFSS